MANTAPRWFGMNPPFIGGAENVLSRQTDDRLIKNDIILLLLTLPGERVYRPAFGTRLRAMVFESPSDSDLLGLAQDVRASINLYEDRVDVQDVLCSLSDDGTTISVRVVMTINGRSLTKFTLELAINQSGTVTVVK